MASSIDRLKGISNIRQTKSNVLVKAMLFVPIYKSLWSNILDTLFDLNWNIYKSKTESL